MKISQTDTSLDFFPSCKAHPHDAFLTIQVIHVEDLS